MFGVLHICFYLFNLIGGSIAAIPMLLPRYLAANPGISSEEALARIYAEASARLAASAVPSALTFGNALSAAAGELSQVLL